MENYFVQCVIYDWFIFICLPFSFMRLLYQLFQRGQIAVNIQICETKPLLDHPSKTSSISDGTKMVLVHGVV